MCVYKSFLQSSLGAKGMSDGSSIHSLHSSRATSNFWVKHRSNLGNSIFMSMFWFIFELINGSVWLWYALSSEWYFPEDINSTYAIIHIAAGSFTLVFALLMLALQWCMTVSESFNISAELTMSGLVMIISWILWWTLWQTKLIVYGVADKMTISIVLVSGYILIQLLIIDYYLWMTTRTSVNPRSKRYTVDLNMVLKDENLFEKFKKQLKREFRVQNLNFLVSCIHYKRAVIAQGNFGIGTSFSESDSETFDMLNWLGAIGDEDTDPCKTARFIHNEFCVRGAPQELNLNENISGRLSARMKNLSNVCNYAERELFSEAFDFIKDTLANDSLIRLKRGLNLPHGVQFHTDIIKGHGYGSPLLASRTQ